MTLVAVPLFRWPGLTWDIFGAPALNTDVTIDAAGEYTSYTFQAREDMTISHVGWRTGTVAGAPTADTRIETVGADGIPTGTLWTANTNIVSGTLVNSTFTLHALTASATILKGEFFNAKIVYASGTSIIVSRAQNLGIATLNVPYRVTNTSGAPVKSTITDSYVMVFGSSATAFYQLDKALPLTAITNTAFNNTAAGDKRGLRFQINSPGRCAGLAFYNGAQVGDFNALLLDDAGSVLATKAFEGDRSGNSASVSTQCLFDSGVDLSIGTWYRAAVEPTSATNIVVGFATLPSLDYRSGWPGGVNHHYTTFTTAGGWIDTATNQVPWMDILFDQSDNGAGAGGGGVTRARVAGGF